MIALALARRTIRHPALAWKHCNDLKAFATEFPGPYGVKEFVHYHRHCEVLVTGTDRTSGIIGFNTLPDDPIAHYDCVYIASALNELLSYWSEHWRKQEH